MYDALVRLAQDFTLRYPLIDGEGNFGSRDGDEAAAYRYTEARLTKFAEVLLSELDQGTVDFVPNYDGTRQEPVVLPARLPVVLLNGASGIAVGMATEIPSHNLNEVAQAAVAMIRDPQLSIAGVMKHIKGPDFPGGGQIITPRAELKEAYTSGRGAVRVRARWNIERLARGQWQVVVYELPPGTSAKKVLEEIEAITNPQPKAGKKSVSPEQQREKQLMLSMLDKDARRERPPAPGAAGVRAAHLEGGRERVRQPAARQDQPGDQRPDQPGDGRAWTAGRPARTCARSSPSGCNSASPPSRAARGISSTRCWTASTCSKDA